MVLHGIKIAYARQNKSIMRLTIFAHTITLGTISHEAVWGAMARSAVAFFLCGCLFVLRFWLYIVAIRTLLPLEDPLCS